MQAACTRRLLHCYAYLRRHVPLSPLSSKGSIAELSKIKLDKVTSSNCFHDPARFPGRPGHCLDYPEGGESTGLSPDSPGLHVHHQRVRSLTQQLDARILLYANAHRHSGGASAGRTQPWIQAKVGDSGEMHLEAAGQEKP